MRNSVSYFAIVLNWLYVKTLSVGFWALHSRGVAWAVQEGSLVGWKVCRCAVDGSECLASLSVCFSLGERAVGANWIGGWLDSRAGLEECLAAAGSQPRFLGCFSHGTVNIYWLRCPSSYINFDNVNHHSCKNLSLFSSNGWINDRVMSVIIENTKEFISLLSFYRLSTFKLLNFL